MNPKIFLKKHEDLRIKSGHLWVFSNEILKTEGEPKIADLVDIVDFNGAFLGSGFYNANSLIAVRILSSLPIPSLSELFTRRIRTAYAFRQEIYPERQSYRLVFSESDFMPGLIIDKYNKTFVLQVYSAGMQENLIMISEILREELGAENIFTKNESHFRTIEGLPDDNAVLLGSILDEIIDDGGIKYKVDFIKGQKTGFYFDQNDNRHFIGKLTSGKTVLDAFCNSGGFGLHAAKAGAEEVVFVDSSKAETENAYNNFQLNNFNIPAEFNDEDVFDYLEYCAANKRKFDVVIIDPPAFAKNKKSLPQAKKGYEKLNKLALNLINPCGYLVTSSCSYHLSKEEFLAAVTSAAQKAGKTLQLIHYYGASLDHPALPSMPETTYLKFAVFKIG